MLTRTPTLDEIDRLQRALAYSAARSDIECLCKRVGKWRDRWYAHDEKPKARKPLDEEDHETVATALRYLDLCGLIERHPSQPWVRVRDIDAGKVAA